MPPAMLPPPPARLWGCVLTPGCPWLRLQPWLGLGRPWCPTWGRGLSEVGEGLVQEVMDSYLCALWMGFPGGSWKGRAEGTFCPGVGLPSAVRPGWVIICSQGVNRSASHHQCLEPCCPERRGLGRVPTRTRAAGATEMPVVGPLGVQS